MRGARQKSRTILASLVVIAAMLMAFAPPADARKGGGRARAKARTSEPTEDCKKDNDCVLVADDCCPCSQGGKQRAIPRKQKDGYEKDRKKRCADSACTEMMSTDATCSQVPLCGAGICELSEPPSPPPAANPQSP